MVHRKLCLLLGLVVLIASAVTSAASGATGTAQPQVINDSQLQASTTTVGGAKVLPTTKTVQHWFGSTLDPHNGVTYGYNMVGADPNTCSGSACDATVTADLTPLNVTFDGFTFSGSDTLAATLASPLFATNDYGSTPPRPNH